MLRYTRSSADPLLHSSVYQVALLLTVIYLVNITLFWTVTSGSPAAVAHWELLPMSLFAVILAVLLLPIGTWHKRGRGRFLRMLRRILTGGLDPDLRFADILLADALTSYSKPLGDIALCILMFVSGYSSTNPTPDRTLGRVLVPCVIALPFLCRFRQCMIEYLRAMRKGLPAADRKPHLYNAAKYASAFPVIILSALQRFEFDADHPRALTRAQTTGAWYVAVFVNSAFSFYWDVARDWELSLFSAKRSCGEFPWGLRQVRHFVNDEVYYGAVGLDFLLRVTWAVKLSAGLDFYSSLEGGVFALQIMEVFRRFVWVFFRVEKEWVVSGRGVGLRMGEVEEGIVMNEYQD